MSGRSREHAIEIVGKSVTFEVTLDNLGQLDGLHASLAVQLLGVFSLWYAGRGIYEIESTKRYCRSVSSTQCLGDLRRSTQREHAIEIVGKSVTSR